MLENLRRKSLVKTYQDPIHQVYFDQGHARYLDSLSIAQYKQRLSKEKIGMSFPKRYFTIPTGFWGIIETLGKVKFNMIYCPSGTFMMGQKGQQDNSPRLETIERSFLLGETEMTQELYEKVMGNNPSHFKNKPQNPVENVSWGDAILFCNELSRLQGLELCYTENSYANYDWSCDFNKNGYRLPEEKEWEYAAKAGTQNRWAGTDGLNKLGEYAWFVENSSGSTHPVKTKKPNEWGFYDMSGNVDEWCWDMYPSPQDICYVLRGGFWDNEQLMLYSTFRSYNRPDACNISSGFRVCRSIVN